MEAADMTTETPTQAPFETDFVVTLLLAGPGRCYIPPRDEQTRAELRRAWGRHGEHVAGTWREHEAWLREMAAARGIQPPFKGKFFAEAMATQGRKP
jgi:hypothetical protein